MFMKNDFRITQNLRRNISAEFVPDYNSIS